MRMIANKVNPAFKLTQPLPLLSADVAQRGGRTVVSVARAMPLAGWATTVATELRDVRPVSAGFKPVAANGAS